MSLFTRLPAKYRLWIVALLFVGLFAFLAYLLTRTPVAPEQETDLKQALEKLLGADLREVKIMGSRVEVAFDFQALTADLARFQAQTRTAAILEVLSTNPPRTIYLTGYTALTASDGQVSRDLVLELVYSGATVAGVAWESYDATQVFALAETSQLHPVLQP